MKETALYKWWQKTKEDLAQMTWRQRIDHIWTYYKVTIVISLVFVFIVGSMIYGRLTAKDILLGGIHANVELTDTGHSHIVTDFFQLREGNASREEVSILDVTLGPIKDEKYFEMNYYNLQTVHTRIGSEQADYILADKVAMENFLSQSIYLDLREFFTTEELEQMENENRLIYLMTVDEDDNPTVDEKYPVAVDVSGLPFFEEYAKKKGEIYFSVVSNSHNKEAVRAFWDYLCAFEVQ